MGEFNMKRRHILGAVNRHAKNSHEIDNQCYNVMQKVIDEQYKENVIRPIVDKKVNERFPEQKPPVLEKTETKNEMLDMEELAKFAAMQTMKSEGVLDEVIEPTTPPPPMDSPPRTPPLEEPEPVTTPILEQKSKKKKPKKEKKSKKKKRKKEKKKQKKSKKKGPSLE